MSFHHCLSQRDGGQVWTSLGRLWLTTFALGECSSNRVTFATARPDRPAERAFDIPVGNHRIGNEPFYAMIAPSTARQEAVDSFRCGSPRTAGPCSYVVICYPP